MVSPTKLEPGIAAQMVWTSSDGPPISVVPESIADKAALPVATFTALPCTVTLETASNQNVGVDGPAIGRNSMSPVKRLELVPPSVKEPPGSSSFTFFAPRKRVSQNAISGAVSWFEEINPCQKGTACVDEMAPNAKPKMPETEPESRPFDVDCTVRKPWDVMEKLPMLTLSVPIVPVTCPEP
jgi:hypothetical protein